MPNLKKLTILHSNDLHGDFLLQHDSTDIFIDSLKIEYEIAKWDSLFYEGDFLHYFVDKETILLWGNASLRYHNMVITADTVIINFDKNQAIAIGRIVMEDGQHLILAQKVYYDIDSETGMIIDGASRFESGFIYGEEMRRVRDDVYDIDRGRFTSCDALIM